jgi:hypothetical protein
MLNREIYLKDPGSSKLVNEGVAHVTDDKTTEALSVLRYELETFVCGGQYERGLEHVLDTFLRNINESDQPGVWVSGFYGSGKSHLIKMLRALWVNTEFEDGATARTLAHLPRDVTDLLTELSVQGKRHGGLHAASGTLGAGASGSVRLALLRIILKSVGLPEQYHVARFVLWLRKEGILDQLRNFIENNGLDWREELDNFMVAEWLFEGLVQLKPKVFQSVEACSEILNNQYPYVTDISNDEMTTAIRQALVIQGKFPLTLIALDEVQQYIGEDSDKSLAVQEAVQACCKTFSGKVLFVGAGQTAVTATANLKKLEGRFTIRVELSDSDVEAVIRKVILAKKPQAIKKIKDVMNANLGEIARHLDHTTIGHRQSDKDVMDQDYPILPVRRRFWEQTLRVLDQTGVDSQLRNQLTMVHKAIQTNLDQPLGHVIPADYLYFDSAEKLLQSRILPRKVHQKTITWNSSGFTDERLMARACGLIFLINKLASNQELGITSNIDTLADLLVEDLSARSVAFRNGLPQLLDKCDLVMKVGDEYRIQTEESASWNDEFLSQTSRLANEVHHLETDRDQRIRKRFGEMVGKLTHVHGKSKVPRSFSTIYESLLPNDKDKKIYVWVRDGWTTDEKSVLADARQAGNDAPTIFVFLPKRSADDLRHNLIEYKAAVATIDKRGTVNSPEGVEARSAMETTKNQSEIKIQELLDEVFIEARVFQGGGTEILGTNLKDMVMEAAQKALMRLYPQFEIADQEGWDKVYSKARLGAPDALKAVGHDGEPFQNQVCKKIQGFIAGTKKGADIRDHFEGAPFGWSRDTVDGALLVLLVGGCIKAEGENGQAAPLKELERKLIGKVTFKVESATVSAAERLQVRKLLIQLVPQVKPSEELSVISEFLNKLEELANKAGGEKPKPELPDVSVIDNLRLTSGNEQILALYNLREDLSKSIDEWKSLSQSIEERWPSWERLLKLMALSRDSESAGAALAEVEAVKTDRLLLAEPDPIQPLINSVEGSLKKDIVNLRKQYSEEFSKRLSELDKHKSWRELEYNQKEDIFQQCEINHIPEFKLGCHEDLVKVLETHPIKIWKDRVDSLSKRFARAYEMAVKLTEPDTHAIELPKRTLKSENDIETWLAEVERELRAAIAKGPVVIL